MNKASTILRRIQLAQGLTVTEMADRLQISRPTLSNVLNGHAGVSVKVALMIEREFHFNARDLLIVQLDDEIQHEQARKYRSGGEN